jgi:hypothetical protein
MGRDRIMSVQAISKHIIINRFSMRSTNGTVSFTGVGAFDIVESNPDR